MRIENDEIQDLITQLNRIQLQQTVLLARLETAVEHEAALNRELQAEVRPRRASAAGNRTEVRPTRAFVVGDRVCIKNPRPFQENKGTITKIGSQRITVTTRSGSKIIRDPKNLALEE
jgi:hypothetical protein